MLATLDLSIITSCCQIGADSKFLSDCVHLTFDLSGDNGVSVTHMREIFSQNFKFPFFSSGLMGLNGTDRQKAHHCVI